MNAAGGTRPAPSRPCSTSREDDERARLSAQADDVAESEEAARTGALPDEAAARDLAIATLRRDLGATLIDDPPS